jgi:hypothetical protein
MINLEEIILAYKRLKSHVYHENSLQILMKVAEFEDETIEVKLQDLVVKLDKYRNGDKSEILKLLEGINFNLMPKSFQNENPEEKGFLYTNQNRKDTYKVDRVTTFISCPVEIHIVSVLWIKFIGTLLDQELGEFCFGNRLQRNSDNDIEDKSIKLFKKYYINYSEWRDKGIKTAKDLYEIGLDVAILNIDIKNYYHSIDFDLDKVATKAGEEFIWLNNLMKEVHAKYAEVLERESLVEGSKNILPIGLLSSAILANHYLMSFDNLITNNLKPAFYGRYVDDIILVFVNPKLKEKDVLKSFIDDHLVNNEVGIGRSAASEITKGDYFILIEKNRLYFQTSKVKLYNFNKDESIKLLEKFEAEIKKNSSEFRFEPESKNILDDFQDSSYKLNYSDTINKFRSVDSLSVDKLGISKHLSKLISSTKFSNEIDSVIKAKLFQQISECFSGQRGLELNSLWEKVYNFYTLHGAVEEIINFTKEQIRAIQAIDKSNGTEMVNFSLLADLKESLLIHLADSFAMSCSLNKMHFTETMLKEIQKLNTKNQSNAIFTLLTIEHIEPKAKSIIKSNLLRHHLIYYPLLNYCKDTDELNFLSKQLYDKNFEFDERKIKFSPRFVHYSELSLFYQFKNIFLPEKQAYKIIIEKTFNDYLRFNKLDKENYEKFFPTSKLFTDYGIKISVGNTSKLDVLKVGIVNSKTILNHSISSMKDKPVLNYDRFDEINHILNQSLKRQKADLIIFPEISVPYQWLPHLTVFAKKNNVAIICGLEHIATGKKAPKEVLNYVATILPFKYKNYSNALVDLRLKKDYSPDEIREIEGRKNFKVPVTKMKNEKLRLYKWNNTCFSVFNCFELADIRKRSIFRGHVDFVVTVEYNRDTNYFSNITDSIARDIHAYIIQVNTSEYGDSRITQPSDSNTKDILKIKGGDNVSLITSSINIRDLREFQKLNYTLQQGNKNFKYTPPNFEIFDRE